MDADRGLRSDVDVEKRSRAQIKTYVRRTLIGVGDLNCKMDECRTEPDVEEHRVNSRMVTSQLKNVDWKTAENIAS